MWIANSIGNYTETAKIYASLHPEFDLSKKYVDFTDLQANDFPWLTDIFVKDINGYIDSFFYSKLLLENISQGKKLSLVTFTDFWEMIKQHTYFAIVSERYHLNGLYKTMFFEYNPIENYNMVEEGNDTNSGTSSSTNTIDKEEKVTADFSNNTNTDLGEQINNVKEYVAPYDSENTNLRNTTTETLGERHDISGSDGTSGSETFGKDTHTFSGTTGNNMTHKLTRSGNIGTTTTQMMIESERRTLSFNFLEIVCKIITNSITRGYL